MRVGNGRSQASVALDGVGRLFAQVPLEDVLTGDAVGNLAGNL